MPAQTKRLCRVAYYRFYVGMPAVQAISLAYKEPAV